MPMTGLLSAGRGVRKWGRQTRRQASVVFQGLIGYVVLAGLIAVLAYAGRAAQDTLMGLALAGFVIVTGVAKIRVGKVDVGQLRREALNRTRGGWAEWRAVLRLNLKLLPYRLIGRGPFFILASRQFGPNADLDVIVVSKAGKFNLDIKERRGKMEILQGELYSGRNAKYNNFGELEKARMSGHLAETKALHSVNTKVPTYSACCVDTGKGRRVRFYEERVTDDGRGSFAVTHLWWNCEGVPWIDVRDMAKFVARKKPVMSRYAAKELAVKVKVRFPVKR